VFVGAFADVANLVQQHGTTRKMNAERSNG
jgi:hypothetical protein